MNHPTWYHFDWINPAGAVVGGLTIISPSEADALRFATFHAPTTCTPVVKKPAVAR